MVNLTDAPAAIAVPAGVNMPILGAALLAADRGRIACVLAPSTTPQPYTATGTSVSGVSPMAHAQELAFGQAAARKPYNYTTRVDAIGGGGPGPHPAREPV